MVCQLFLVTYDNTNFQWTVLKPNWKEKKIPAEVSDLDTIETDLRIWGVKPGQGNEEIYERMEREDYLLFYNNKKYRHVGRIGKKFRSETFARDNWVEGTECTMLYTVNELKKIDASRRRINDVFDYEKRRNAEWNPQGVHRVEPSRVEGLLEEFGSISGFIDELVEEAEQEPWWEK